MVSSSSAKPHKPLVLLPPEESACSACVAESKPCGIPMSCTCSAGGARRPNKIKVMINNVVTDNIMPLGDSPSVAFMRGIMKGGNGTVSVSKGF